MPTFFARPLLVLVVIWATLLPNLYGQVPQSEGKPATVHLSDETFASQTLLDLSTVLWRFHAGDDPFWADSSLDDAAWGLLKTDLQPDSLSADRWQGLGWFRLHLQVDSSLHNTLLALHMYQAGASEIYLDGQRIGGFGTIGATAENDQTYIPLGLPLTMHLDDSDEHVLAVRYANRNLAPWEIQKHHQWPFRPAGFALVVGPNTEATHSYVFEKSALYAEAAMIGLLFAILILHLLLYLFDRRDRANFYYAMALVFLCIGLFCGHAMGYPVLLIDGAWSAALIDEVGNQTFVVFVVLLLATLYSLFAPHLLRFLWGGFLLWVTIGMLWFLLGIPYLFPSFPLPALLLLLETVRVSAYAIYQRKEGAWILGAAMLFTLGTVLFIYLTGIGLPPADDRIITQHLPYLIERRGYTTVLFGTPIPLGMSMLLAQRFARRNRRLERELVRVEELSAQTLAQEREKQALVASQNERLEVEVAERTAALEQSLADLKTTQAQLVQQEKMASLGTLTAGIAHEIKNPLNFVNNFAALSRELAEELEEETDPDEIQEILAHLKSNAAKIEEHGRRADGIVRSMLEHSRGNSGERRSIDLNALVEEYATLAYHGKRAQTPDFNAAIEKDLDATVGQVEVVPQGLGRVLLNLLSNAFDAVYERATQVNGSYTPTVRISTQRVAEQVEIRVSDNGPGIPEEIQTKIFEPFFTTKPTGSATGLGLSLSYDIITQGHGGTLTAASATDQGATFTIALPLHQTEAASR